MKDESLRVFFAITLDKEIKDQITNHIEKLKKTCPLSVRWVKDSQLHLTLRFLGNVSSTQLNSINDHLNTLHTCPSFNLELEEVMAFPINKPRIIGISIHLSEELASLVKLLESVLNELGIEPEERAFLPHITIGRIAKPRRRSLQLEQLDVLRKQPVKHITLFKSELTPQGSIYTPLKEFNLKG